MFIKLRKIDSKLVKMIDLSQLESGKNYSIHVKPNASVNTISVKDDKIMVYTTAVPENNKANKAVIRLFKKQLKLKIIIVKGATSTVKLIHIE